MRLAAKRHRSYFVVAALLFCCGCDRQPTRAPAPPAEAKYELQKDAQGRILRLNTATGDVAVLSGMKLLPVGPSNTRSSPATESRFAGLATRGGTGAAGQTGEKAADRFELLKDTQGRIVRLNKITGDVALVIGAGLIPVELSNERERSASIVRRDGPTSSAGTGAGLQSRPEDASSARTTLAVAADVVSPVLAQLPYGSTITIATRSPMFLLPDRRRVPLRELSAGVAVKFLGTEGDWYRIQFEDPYLGHQVGFIERKSFAVPMGNLEPADLSVRTRKPTQTELVDLSIGNPKADSLKPMDLSIRKPNADAMEPVDLSIRKPK